MFKRRSYVLNLLTFVIACTLSLIIVEALLSKYLPYFNPAFAVSCFRNNEGVPLLWPRPSEQRQSNAFGEYDVAVSINKFGLRDKKEINSSNINDIFVVGDSFTFGHGVEEDERFSNILESISGIKVYNLGIPGTDLADYVRIVNYAKNNGALIHNLIIAVFMGKDRGIKDYSNDQRLSRPTLIRKIKDFLNSKSTTYKLLSYSYNKYNIINNLKGMFGIKSEDKDIDVSYEIIYGSAMKLQELSNGYNTLILIIPSVGLWMGDLRDMELRKHINFVNLLRNMNMNVIDLRAAFEEKDPLIYFFKQDGHFNKQGHAIAGNILGKYIKDKRYPTKD